MPFGFTRLFAGLRALFASSPLSFPAPITARSTSKLKLPNTAHRKKWRMTSGLLKPPYRLRRRANRITRKRHALRTASLSPAGRPKLSVLRPLRPLRLAAHGSNTSIAKAPDSVPANLQHSPTSNIPPRMIDGNPLNRHGYAWLYGAYLGSLFPNPTIEPESRVWKLFLGVTGKNYHEKYNAINEVHGAEYNALAERKAAFGETGETTPTATNSTETQEKEDRERLLADLWAGVTPEPAFRAATWVSDPTPSEEDSTTTDADGEGPGGDTIVVRGGRRRAVRGNLVRGQSGRGRGRGGRGAAVGAPGVRGGGASGGRRARAGHAGRGVGRGGRGAVARGGAAGAGRRGVASGRVARGGDGWRGHGRRGGRLVRAGDSGVLESL